MHLVALARLASYFLLFSQKKVTKEKATPLPFISCAASQNWAAAELALTSHIKNGLLRSSNSPRLFPNFTVLLGAAQGIESQNHAFATVDDLKQ
jgi:hypothetical protein